MKFALSGLILLEANFRHAVDPFATPVAPHPQTDVPMELGLLKGEAPHTYIVTLRVAIESAPSFYAISVRYAALLTIDPEGAELPPHFEQQVLVIGATMAFPYCRELVSNLSARARFGPLWLNPTNFQDVLKEGNATPAVTREHPTTAP
jgi:preprotein translocase subunit SecB